jgi:dTDP-4-amino-4,6-dideoxygalactose transaminase
MWIRKRLDLGWADLFAGMAACMTRRDEQAIAARIEAGWGSAPGQWVACLSVRTGLDLVLRALAWPAGSEVLVSALTIPDMARIVREHGLVPVPIDLDPRSMGPALPSLERACTPQTRGILVAHLFGSRLALEPLLEFARERGLLLFEDCAQAFEGRAYAGHIDSDVAMFSFGTIKTATALGGALLRIANLELAGKIRALHADYPVQTNRNFLARVLKYALLKGLSGRAAAAVLFSACRLFGVNTDRALNRIVRGFAGEQFWQRLRRRPGPALLALLERRLAQDHSARLARRKALGERLALKLDGAVELPADESAWHSYWVFPVMLKDPAGAIAELARHGFDLTQGESMHVVPPPQGRPELKANVAEECLSRIVYLPNYADLTESAVDRMADALRKHMISRRGFERAALASSATAAPDLPAF